MTSDTARRVRRALDGDRTVTVTRNFPLDDIRVLSRAEGGDGRTVTAYAAVFNDPTEIWDQDGHYDEQIHPNGFHNTLQQRRAQVFCVYNHAKNLSGGPSDLWSVPVGVPLPGSEGIRTDAKGLLTVTRYNTDEASSRILEAIKSGSLTGMSFTGVFLRSDPELTGPWSEYGPNKLGELPLVTRMEVALIEYGATPIPAYDHAQVVGVRARQEAEGRASVMLLDPDVIRAMNAAAAPAVPDDEQQRALTAASTPQMAQGQQPMIHPDVKAAPSHDTAAVLVTPDTAQEAKWDSQQWETAMQFPADLAHMHSLYALYDTSGQFADGTFAKSSGHLPHHLVDDNGAPGPHHPDAVKQALETLPALPVTDDQREAARKHLQAHLDAEARSETDQDPPGETGATNGSGTNTKVSVVPTSSSGRDDDADHERGGETAADTIGAQSRPEVWDAQMRAADEYAAAVLEVTGDGPQAASAFAHAIMGQLASGRAWDPDHDGDNDSDPVGDTDHDFFDSDGEPRPPMSAEGRGGDAPGDGKLPYGHVHYADPGLQKDGKKRYPLDSKDHAKSAWEFISEEANAGKYSAGDLAKVKAAIEAACKKFGVATSEDDAAGGKNATSSSGRQPAAEDQQTRAGDGDAGTEGTGPPAERADAAPLTHPATDDDTSSSNGSITMDGPMKVADRKARVTVIQERMTAIHALHPDGDVPEDLDTEFKTLGEEMTRHGAAIKDASERAQMIAAFTAAGAGTAEGSAHGETAVNPGFTDGGGQGDGAGGEAGQRSKFTGAPNFIPSVDRSALYDLDAVKASARNYTDLPRAYRDRAMKILEVDGRGFPTVRYSPPGEPHITRSLTMEDAQTRVATLLDTIDDENGSLARRIMVTGNPTYERAFGKAMSHLSIVGLDDAESRALALGVDAQGGYAVPFQLDPTVILTSNGAINPLRHLARVETITGKEWDGVTSAGVTVTRAAEGTEVGTGDAAFIQPSVRTTRVQGFVPFSVELDVSWGALRSQMTALLMDAKDIEEATAFVSGNGTGANPTGLITGITNATAGTASTVTTAGTAALAVGDLYALENAMPPRFRQQSAYLASRTTYNRFRQLFQALASAAFDSWVRPSGGQPATFNGYPAFELSTMSAALTSGSQVLVQGDYRQFLIVDRVGMGIELVPHLFGGTNRYPTGQRGILAIWFNSSQVLVPNAFRLLATT